MNDLDTLQSMGLSLPSPAYLVGVLLFSIVGYIAFRHGRKAERKDHIWVGLALMLYPYAVSQTLALWLVGAVMSAWVVWKWN